MAIPEKSVRSPEAALKLEPLPIALLAEPLDYLFADHFRHRLVTAALRRFSADRCAPRAEADQVAAFLDRDLALHHLDEEEDLFPALRQRAAPQDNLGLILARLVDDHRQSVPLVEAIVAALSRRAAEDPVRIARADRETMQAFARLEQHHLAIENGIVLVIARKRLTASDLAGISRSMKSRRGAEA